MHSEVEAMATTTNTSIYFSSPEDLNAIRRAAEISGVGLGRFIRDAAQAAATKVNVAYKRKRARKAKAKVAKGLAE